MSAEATDAADLDFLTLVSSVLAAVVDKEEVGGAAHSKGRVTALGVAGGLGHACVVTSDLGEFIISG